MTTVDIDNSTRDIKFVQPLETFTRGKVIALSAVMAVIFSSIALLVTVFYIGKPISSLFTGNFSILQQILTGTVSGIVLAVISLIVALKSDKLTNFRKTVNEVMENIQPGKVDMLLVALLAGWSEELLFRGIVQPLIGIWLTSLLFVIVHGVVDVRDKSKRTFGVFVFCGSMIMGLIYQYSGLAAAMAAHATYDFVILLGLSYYISKSQ